jgi:hypothetical protein
MAQGSHVTSMRRFIQLSSRRFRIAALAIVVLAALVLVGLSLRRIPVPSGLAVRGKPIEQWIDIMVRNSWEAMEAMREAGVNATPFLREPLSRRSTLANTFYVKVWPNLPSRIQQHLVQPVLAKDARMNTVALLRDVPEVARVMIADLMPRLRDEDGTISLHTAITMGNIGPAAKESLPILLEFTKSDKSTVRIYSARALWKVSGQVEPALTVLEAGIQDNSAKFRWAALVFLGKMGTNALRAVPLLVEASKDADKEVGSLAIQALAEIGGADTVPVLIEHLRSDDASIRASAATALGKLGPKAKTAIPALNQILTDSALADPAIMGRVERKEKVSDAARGALQELNGQ